ncbi:hypothetical protein KBC70_01360 [Candidatus Woesebacteria bacterium]|nr:hypothetical protein [Candidatus Woesebacteria bacterium]
MESLADKLRELTHNKYFAVIAIVFFAFLTALVFALFALQQTNPQTPEQIRSGVQNNSTTAQPISGNGSQKSPSTIDRIIAVISGKDIPQSSAPSPSQKTSTTLPQDNTISKTTAFDTHVAQKLDDVSTLPPLVNIGKHVLVTQLPTQPASVSIYELKKNYSTDEVKDLAYSLGFNSIDGVEKGENLMHMYDIDSLSYLSINPETGRFTYLSESGFRPTLPTASSLQLGKNIASQVGIDSPSLKPFATYTRDDDNGDYIYIELHNQWEAFGAPILNPLGMLNLKENVDITSVTLGSTQGAPYRNIHITDTSDNTDGYARRSDFNTVTIKYLPSDGRIYGVSSNISKILKTETLAGDAIMTPTEAYNNYVSGKTTFSAVGPSGEGSANLNDIYSNNLAKATTVDVSDIEYIYATGPQSTPQWWCPVYVFRSFGKIQTGFESQFVHTVPATDDARCQSAVLGIMAQAPSTPTLPSTQSGPTQTAPTGGAVLTPVVGTGASSLQYGTAEFISKVVVDTPANECPTDFNHSLKIAETPNQIEYMMWIDKNVYEKDRKDPSVIGRDWWYVVKRKASASLSLVEIKPTKSKSQLEAARSRLVLAGGCSIGNPSDCPLSGAYTGLETVTCQYITTGSPWIHLYPEYKQQMSVSLNPTGGTAYVQPEFTSNKDGQWSFIAEPSGKLAFANGLHKTGLHWEYYRYPLIQAYRPTLKSSDPGFVIDADQLKPFVTELALRIGLNAVETSNLLSELNRQSNAIKEPYVKIGFVSESFLEDFFPLSIQPQPDHLYRIYLDIQPLSTRQNVSTPQIPHVSREGSVAVETGVIFPY